MTGKALITIIVSAALLVGCSTTPPPAPLPTEKPAPTLSSTNLPPAVPTLRPKTATRHPTAKASAKPAPSKDLADHINGTVVQNGRDLFVTRGTQQPPVPLFRQAIVLATVRTTLNNSPAAPQASFQRGELHLRFDRGTKEQIASTINRVLAISEVNRLHATIP